MKSSRKLSWGSRKEAREVSDAGDVLGLRVLPSIPHVDYRVLVTTAAQGAAKSRGANAASTLDFANAKSKVDKLLLDRGLGVAIPAARPGRVTR